MELMLRPGTERWDVYGELRARSHVIFGLCDLPKPMLGVYMPIGKRALIMISAEINQCMRKAVLAHELIHDEEGGGCVLEGMPAQYRVVAAREERRIDLEVARRLIPEAELLVMAEIARDNQLPLEPWHVAEHFDVPQRYADLRCGLVDISVRKAS
jgi:hypothetical protein